MLESPGNEAVESNPGDADKELVVDHARIDLDDLSPVDNINGVPSADGNFQVVGQAISRTCRYNPHGHFTSGNPPCHFIDGPVSPDSNHHFGPAPDLLFADIRSVTGSL